MNRLATPIIWIFRPIRKRWLGRNLANIISLARVPLMIWILSKLPYADAWETVWLILWVGAVQTLDGLDGAVARGLNTSNATGGTIDGIVDKLNTLMFIGLLVWTLPRDGMNVGLIFFICVVIVMVMVFQVLSAVENNRRRELSEELHEEFRSRLPAQVNFIASMLTIAICWVIPSDYVAALALGLGAATMMVLSIWSLDDYTQDRQRLEMRVLRLV